MSLFEQVTEDEFKAQAPVSPQVRMPVESGVSFTADGETPDTRVYCKFCKDYFYESYHVERWVP